MGNIQFDFGENWKNYSEKILQTQNIKDSFNDFCNLIGNENITNKTFLDIGFGQGLGLLNASKLGAKAVGCDINPKCREVLNYNRLKFPEIKDVIIPVVIGSILNDKDILEIENQNQKYDIVHSWGVLHHTGDMWKAIENSCKLVSDNGLLIIAIYNKHWSSPLWKSIKQFYNIAPKFVKWLMVNVFYIIIFVAKFLVTFKNPLKKERGMSFYYDIIDWLGGYPYEYASLSEIIDYIEAMNFLIYKTIKAKTPTGCNEFVFKKEDLNDY